MRVRGKSTTPTGSRRRRLGSVVVALAVSAGAFFGAPAAHAEEPEIQPFYDTGVFTVWTHIQNMGWTDLSGSVSQSLRLEAIRVYQKGDRRFCARVHVATIGWQASQCTSTSNRQITLGTTGRNLAIEAVEVWTPGYNFKVSAHVQNIGWMERTTAYAGQHVTIGTTGRGLRMEAFSFAPYNW